MKTLLCSALIFICTASVNAQTIGQLEGEYTHEEQFALDTIASLKEVKKMGAEIGKQSGSAINAYVWLFDLPKGDLPYYWIKAGDPTNKSSISAINFLVSQDLKKVFFLNVDAKEIGSLDDMRKRAGK